jgi:hypothetical protein
MWGLIIKHEQLLKYAGHFKEHLAEKKNYNYFIAALELSEPCIAFFISSCP